MQPETRFRRPADIEIAATTLGPPVQVRQAATAHAFPQTDPVVDDDQLQTLLVGLHPYPNLRGLSMFRDIGQ